MRIKDIKDVCDLRDLGSNDVVDLLDELRVIAGKRGTELLAQGRTQARRAIGAPGEGTMGVVFLVGIALGAVVAAVATMLMSPMTGTEARRRLNEQVERVRVRASVRGNGHARYEPVPRATEVASAEEVPTA